MRLYHAGNIGASVACDVVPGCNTMMSFHHHRARLDELAAPHVVLDSGAYSANTLGAVIHLEEYAEVLHTIAHRLAWYINLDVVGDGVASQENLEALESLGLHPVPVFTRGAPWADLERLAEKYELLCFGGLVSMSRTEQATYLDKCFAVLRDYWPVKVHALGKTSKPLLLRYPFYSCDSSRWTAGGRYGQVFGRDGKNATKAKQVGMQDRNENEKRYAERMVHNIHVTNRMAEDVTRAWTARGITW